MAKLIAFFEKGEERQPTMLYACHKAVKGSKEKDSVKGRVSLWMCPVKKLFLKVLQYTQEPTCAGVFF